MEVGVIGLARDGEIVARQLLGKMAGDLFGYDPEGRAPVFGVRMLSTAAELCERCDRIILALSSAEELHALCNGVSEYLHEGQIFIDLTGSSPALAHALANGMRRRDVSFLDCGIFGRDGLAGEFLCFAGGNSQSFSEVWPLIRCFAPNCRYVGPSGRGRAVRLLCGALAVQIGQAVEESARLAGSLGIERAEFLTLLDGFEQIADPLAILEGAEPGFSSKMLAVDASVAAEMARRAGLPLGGLFSAALEKPEQNNQ